MIFVLAEKPAMAAELRKAIKEPGVVFGAARGHLFELQRPNDYLEESRYLTLEDLPIVPPNMAFKYLLKKDDPKFKDRGQSYKELVASLTEQADKADEIVCATDAGREGELIFWEFLRHFQKKHPKSKPRLSRLWAQSTTHTALQDAYEKRQPLSRTMGLAQAAHGRQWADWIWGMNLSSAAQASFPKSTDGKTWSIGRVQTPVLAILVDREDEISTFQAKPFWEIEVTVKNENHADAYTAKLIAQAGEETPNSGEGDAIEEESKASTRTRFTESTQVEALRAKCGEIGRTWAVTETKTRSVSKPPSLFSLASLQQHMNRTFGWSAADTLKIAQSCYETYKILTYPRTESDGLPADYVETADKLHAIALNFLQVPAEKEDLFPKPSMSTRRKAIFDDAKISDHFAIVPTGETIPAAADANAKTLYRVVTERFLTTLADEAVYEVCARQLKSEDLNAAARGRVLVSAGWTASKRFLTGLNTGAAPAEPEKEEAVPALPPLDPAAPRATTVAPGAKSREGKTAPPPHHTEASLLSAMEHVDRLILARKKTLTEDDEETEEAIEDESLSTLASAAAKRGLGTPATRAAIIELLLNPARQYITRSAGEGKKSKKKKTYLIPTEKGNFLIKTLRGVGLANVADPITTAEWEVKLQRLEETGGEFLCNVTEFSGAENYINELLPLVRGAIDKLKPLAAAKPQNQAGTPTETICPKSGQPVTDNGSFYRFPGYPKAYFNKEICGTNISAEDFRKLVANPGTPSTEMKFTSPKKKGETFKAKLVFETKDEKVNFYRDPGQTDASGAICPSSKKPVTSNEKQFFFAGYPATWFNKTLCGREMSAEDYIKVLGTKDGAKFDGFISPKTGKTFPANLVYNTRKKSVEFDFNR